MEGRRARLRAELMADIRAAGLSELRRTGPAMLSLRDVAKVAGISPSGMYRYVDGRDGLLELLISDGFDALGAAVDKALSASEPDLLSQLDTIATTYRRWALENPEQFGLILGTPIPGFDARQGGPTTSAVLRFGGSMIRPFARAYADGRLPAIDQRSGDFDLSEFDPDFGTVPAALVEVVLRGWGRIHGLVSLEVFGHLGWTGTDVSALLASETRSIVEELTSVPGVRKESH